MLSDIPKPLHEVGGRTMIDRVLDALVDERIDEVIVVVGHGGELVRRQVEARTPSGVPVTFVLQNEQLGTGHAAYLAIETMSSLEGAVLILPGDTPLLRASSVSRLLDQHFAGPEALSVLSAIVDDATGYGRIVRNDVGSLERIVEEKDASDAERAIREFNTGIMIGSAGPMKSALKRIGRGNAQGEYYLTDVIALLVGDQLPVQAVVLEDSREAQGVNDPAQLAYCEKVLAERSLQ